MKKVLIVIVLLAAGLAAFLVLRRKPEGGAQSSERITMSGAWALYPMGVRWGEEYKKLHPEVRFDISAGGAGKGVTDALTGAADIGMVSRDLSAAELEKGAWFVTVTKDAVVPMINAAHPQAEKLLAKGATRETLTGIWVGGTVKTWGQVLGDSSAEAISVFSRSDACGAAETWAKYLGNKKQEDLKGTAVYGDPGLAAAVAKDPLGIGFNNVNFAYDAKTGKPVPGVRPLPIDVDGSGAVEPKENFYATRDELVKAIADGRYPSPPARGLHFVSKGAPDRPAVAAFVRWVLTDGQKFVPESGYVNLDAAQLIDQIKKLSAPAAVPAAPVAPKP
ncbi:MAG TPA: extracellular solute-binding protein [Planctomycetota bacterium]|nr:extracellular solute-binding protein [Planctomycetota bacterium]